MWILDKPIVGHNLVADLPHLWKSGYLPGDVKVFDTYVAAHFRGHQDKSLGDLMVELFQTKISGFDTPMLEGKFPTQELKDHNSTDVLATQMLYDYFSQFDYPPSFYLDMEFIPVLAGMIDRGLRIDEVYAKKLHKKLERRLRRISLPINPASPKQVCAYLGCANAQAPTLEKMESEEAQNIVKWKQLDKAIDYIEQYLRAADVNGRIHPNLNIAGTVTGRLACSKPPLHSCEKSIEMRGMFRPTPGYKFIIFDYDQGEYQIAAVLSGDKDLIESLKTESPHAYVAKKMGVSYAEAKTANFAALNLGNAETVAYNCNCSLSVARDFIDNYPLARWARETVSRGVADGYTSTPLGRTRVFTKPSEGVTMTVQGGLAEVGKEGVVKAAKAGYDYTIHNQHDEYIWEYEEQYAGEAAIKIKACMEDNSFGIPVTGGIYDSWGQSLIKKGESGCGVFI